MFCLAARLSVIRSGARLTDRLRAAPGRSGHLVPVCRRVVVLGPALDVEPVVDRSQDRQHLAQQLLVEGLLGPAPPIAGRVPGWPTR